MQTHPAWTLERFERTYDGRQLHTIVGGKSFAAIELLAATCGPHQNAPAADSGITLARAIRENVDYFIHRIAHG
jgi:hypothetical protein